MEQSVFRYVFNHLFVLSDEELGKIDFNYANSVLKKSDIPSEQRDKLIKLFNNIQNELPLSHHGILGQKWGVRRYQNKDGTLTNAGKKHYDTLLAKQSIFGTASAYQIKTRNGEVITAEPVKPWSVGKKILRAIIGDSEKDEMGRRGDANYTLNNSKGEKIGELSLISKNKDVAYMDWITIDDSQRGKGYATDIINDLLVKAKDSGYLKVELNALKKPRALYERIGFTYSNNLSIMDRIAGFEFGCKRMEYNLEKVKHSYMFGDFLSHHGILGQKWGVRRYQNKDGTLTNAGKKRKASVASHEDYQKAHTKKSVKTMSDAELRSRLNRLQMEQQYSKLSQTNINRGKNIVSKTFKATTGIATFTTTAITLYNNYDKIKNIVKSTIKK